MALNLNESVSVLGAVAATDVSVVGGTIFIKGADSINKYKVQGVPQYFGTSAGKPGIFTITSTAAIAAATTYSGVMQQVLSGETINFPFSYTTGASAPSAANFYIALAAVIQAGIDGGAVFGTLTNSASGVVFTGTIDAPVIAFASSTLTSTQTTTAITVSAVSNATPRVLTATSHGLTVGAVYNITITGLTGSVPKALGELNGRTYPCIPTGINAISVIGTSATGAVTLVGSPVFTLNNNALNTFYTEAGRFTGYDPTKPYVGLQVAQVSDAAVESGVVIPSVIMVDATVAVNATDAALGGFFGAINDGLV
jgi:hypothetical protein